MYDRFQGGGRPDSEESARPDVAASNPLIWGDDDSSTPAIALEHVLLVGDPGLHDHNVGTNFVRSAETREAEIKAQGDNVAITRISTVEDMNAALNAPATITGRIEYYGHGWESILYIGQGSGASTNLGPDNVDILDGSKIAPGVIMQLFSCNGGKGGADSIAQLLANQLKIPVIGSVRPLGFTGTPGVYLHGEHASPPASGPLYMTPPSQSNWVTLSPA